MTLRAPSSLPAACRSRSECPAVAVSDRLLIRLARTRRVRSAASPGELEQHHPRGWGSGPLRVPLGHQEHAAVSRGERVLRRSGIHDASICSECLIGLTLLCGVSCGLAAAGRWDDQEGRWIA